MMKRRSERKQDEDEMTKKEDIKQRTKRKEDKIEGKGQTMTEEKGDKRRRRRRKENEERK